MIVSFYEILLPLKKDCCTKINRKHGYNEGRVIGPRQNPFSPKCYGANLFIILANVSQMYAVYVEYDTIVI